MRCSRRVPIVLAAAFLGGMLLCGCSEDDEDGPAPANCLREPPVYGTLKVSVTIDGRYPSVPVLIYEDNWEQGHEVLCDTLVAEREAYLLRADRYYSVLALYIQNGDTLGVLDGDKIEIESTEYTDATCYDVEDGDVDVRLPD